LIGGLVLVVSAYMNARWIVTEVAIEEGEAETTTDRRE